MLTLDLERWGVQELTSAELQETDGGVAPAVIYILIALYLGGTIAAVSQGRNPHTGGYMHP